MTETERLVMWEIGRPHAGSTPGPQDIATQLSVSTGTRYTWQGVAAVARRLKSRGYIRIHSLTKITYYELTPSGREVLPECRRADDPRERTA